MQNGAVGGKFPAGKRGIAKAVAKGVERFFLHKTVGAALHGVILKGRQMVLLAVKCDGQPSAEVRKTKNQLCKRPAAQRAGIRAMHNSGGVLLCPVQGKSAPGKSDNNQWLAKGRCRFQQMLLQAGQAQIRLIAAAVLVAGIALLALDRGIQPDYGHDHIGGSADRLCLADAVIGLRQTACAVLIQVAALRIQHAGVRADGVLDPFQHRDITRGRALIVADQCGAAVGVGSDYGKGLLFCGVQRQDAVVFQQHGALEGNRTVKGCHLGAVHDSIRNFVKILRVFAKDPQPDAGRQQIRDGLVQTLLRYLSVVYRIDQMLIKAPGIQIAAAVHRQSGGILLIGGHAVALVEILDGIKVRGDMPVKAPFAAQQVLKQLRIAAAGDTVQPIVRPHNDFDLCLLHAGAEGGQVGFCHVFGRCFGVEGMAHSLGAAVYSKMLGAGSRAQMVGVMPLHPLNKPHSQPGG